MKGRSGSEAESQNYPPNSDAVKDQGPNSIPKPEFSGISAWVWRVCGLGVSRLGAEGHYRGCPPLTKHGTPFRALAFVGWIVLPVRKQAGDMF